MLSWLLGLPALVREHPKKSSAVLTLGASCFAYSQLGKLKQLVEPLQAEAQALVMKRTTHDMTCVLFAQSFVWC